MREGRSGKLGLNRQKEFVSTGANSCLDLRLAPITSVSVLQGDRAFSFSSGWGLEDSSVVVAPCDHLKEGWVLSLKSQSSS